MKTMKAKSMNPTHCNEWLTDDGQVFIEEVGWCDLCGDENDSNSKEQDLVPMHECDDNGICSGKIILVCDNCRKHLDL